MEDFVAKSFKSIGPGYKLSVIKDCIVETLAKAVVYCSGGGKCVKNLSFFVNETSIIYNEFSQRGEWNGR